MAQWKLEMAQQVCIKAVPNIYASIILEIIGSEKNWNNRENLSYAIL